MFIIFYIYIYIYISAVKRLIAITRIQNKSFCLHDMCLYCVYVLCIYKYTHMHEYISEYMLCLYIKYIYL